MTEAGPTSVPKSVRGELIEAGAARGIEARLSESMGRLRLSWRDDRGGETALAVNATTDRLSDGVKGVPRRLTLADGRVFVAPDSPQLTALARAGGLATPGRFLSWAEKFRLRSALVLSLALVAVLFGLRWAVPILADGATTVVPPVVERAMGEQSFAVFDRGFTEPTTLPEARRETLTEGFQTLLAAADLPGDIDLVFRSTPGIGPNALAFPGGPVVLTDELVALAESDGEVLAVLAHEVAHVKERHVLKRVLRLAGLGMLIGLAVGDGSAILEDVAGVPALLMDRSYSRDFERQADDGAVVLMEKTNLDPALLSRMLGRLAEVCGSDCAETSWLSSHPGMVDRLPRLPGGPAAE